MLVVIKKDYEEVSREAAHIVAGAVRAKPTIVLGLATGSTPLGLYQELIALHRAGSLDFRYRGRSSSGRDLQRPRLQGEDPWSGDGGDH